MKAPHAAVEVGFADSTRSVGQPRTWGSGEADANNVSPVFAARHGGRLTPQAVNQMIKKAAAKAGVDPAISSHPSTRSACCCRDACGGWCRGHGHIGMTQGLLHLGERRAAIESVGPVGVAEPIGFRFSISPTFADDHEWRPEVGIGVGLDVSSKREAGSARRPQPIGVRQSVCRRHRSRRHYTLGPLLRSGIAVGMVSRRVKAAGGNVQNAAQTRIARRTMIGLAAALLQAACASTCNPISTSSAFARTAAAQRAQPISLPTA
jgi:hypothetical protein